MAYYKAFCFQIDSKNDVHQNIYYKSDDIGKNIVSFLQDEMKINTVDLPDSPFDLETLQNEKDIVVNSNATKRIDTENCITINTWDYQNARFEDFQLLNDKFDVSDDLKELIHGYILAVRSIEDMAYSVMGGSSTDHFSCISFFGKRSRNPP